MTNPTPKLRWFEYRLNRVLFPLLAVEGFLLLSERVGWFGFQAGSGRAAAIAVVVVIVPILVMCFWMVARFVFRRRFRRILAFEPVRWYDATPDRFVTGLIVLECLLWLSEQFRWFPFNSHKGWTVLIAAALFGAAFLLMLLWSAVCLLFQCIRTATPSDAERRRPGRGHRSQRAARRRRAAWNCLRSALSRRSSTRYSRIASGWLCFQTSGSRRL